LLGHYDEIRARIMIFLAETREFGENKEMSMLIDASQVKPELTNHQSRTKEGANQHDS
jgi:hypothetical protein